MATVMTHAVIGLVLKEYRPAFGSRELPGQLVPLSVCPEKPQDLNLSSNEHYVLGKPSGSELGGHAAAHLSDRDQRLVALNQSASFSVHQTVLEMLPGSVLWRTTALVLSLSSADEPVWPRLTAREPACWLSRNLLQ